MGKTNTMEKSEEENDKQRDQDSHTRLVRHVALVVETGIYLVGTLIAALMCWTVGKVFVEIWPVSMIGVIVSGAVSLVMYVIFIVLKWARKIRQTNANALPQTERPRL